MRWCFFILMIVWLSGCESKSLERKVTSTESRPTALEPEQITAKVMDVIDGDTIVVMNEIRKSMTIQIKGVDAPELEQAFGNTAHEKLTARIEGKIVRVALDEADEFGRRTAEVFENDKSVNVWLIRQGCGWHNWKFDADDAKAAAEKQARKDKAGLWAAKDPRPPWEWKNPPDDGKFYVQGNGTRYHRASCRTLDSRRQEIGLADALETHSPCRVCNPPTEIE